MTYDPHTTAMNAMLTGSDHQVVNFDALTYAEREEEESQQERLEEIEIGLTAMANKHGWQRVVEAVERLAKDR